MKGKGVGTTPMSVMVLCSCQELLSVIESIVKSSPENKPRRPRGGVEVKLYYFFNLSIRWRWVVNTTPLRLTPRKDPAPLE